MSVEFSIIGSAALGGGEGGCCGTGMGAVTHKVWWWRRTGREEELEGL